MSDYTPTTDEVLDAWADFRCDHSNSPLTYKEALDQFDRWLADHDAEVEAKARADEREKAVERVEACPVYADVFVEMAAAVAAARGEDNGHE